MANASELKKGIYFLYNGEPVQVKKREIVVVGTHSHSKLKIYYSHITSRGEKSVIYSHKDRVDILDIIKKVGQVISKANNKIQVMDMQSYETFDASIDAELFNQINENDEIIFIDYNKKYQILEKKR